LFLSKSRSLLNITFDVAYSLSIQVADNAINEFMSLSKKVEVQRGSFTRDCRGEKQSPVLNMGNQTELIKTYHPYWNGK